jgi:hypothetical protein
MQGPKFNKTSTQRKGKNVFAVSVIALKKRMKRGAKTQSKRRRRKMYSDLKIFVRNSFCPLVPPGQTVKHAVES